MTRGWRYVTRYGVPPLRVEYRPVSDPQYRSWDRPSRSARTGPPLRSGTALARIRYR